MVCDKNYRFGIIFELSPTCFQFIQSNTQELFYQAINQCLVQYLIDEGAPMVVNCPTSITCQNSQKKNIILGMIQAFYFDF